MLHSTKGYSCYFALFLLSTLTITACGGGGGSDSPPQTPVAQVNTAPVAVQDSGQAQNNQPVTLDVLVNDTDSQSDSLTIDSITREPSFGTVEIVDNKIVFTPQENFAGNDSFSYQISDGELTAEADVTMTINHTLTLSGKVTDDPIANAVVTVSLNEDSFSTTADQQGNYDLEITINDFSAMIYMEAVGSAELNQQNVVLINFPGSALSAFEKMDDQRNLSSDTQQDFTNLTHVSTASYLLMKDRAEDGVIATDAALTELKANIAAEDIRRIMGFIKLLVDNSDYVIPEGETILSLLDSADATLTTLDNMNTYLTANGHLDADNNETEAYLEDLNAAVAATVADPNVIAGFTEDMLKGKMFLSVPATREDWLPYLTSGVMFDDDSNGKNMRIRFGLGSAESPEIYETSWMISDGTLVITSEDIANTFTPSLNSSFDELVIDYGFDPAILNALIEAYESGSFNGQLELNVIVEETKLTLLTATDSAYQTTTQENYVYQFIVPDGVEWPDTTVKSAVQTDEYSNTLLLTEASLFENMQLSDLAGRWIFHLEHELQSFFTRALANSFVASAVTLEGNSAIIERDNQQFSATLEQGTLIIAKDELQYTVTPLLKEDKYYFAKIEKWIDNQLIYAVGRVIAKFDNSYTEYTDNLVTDLPEIQSSFINGDIADAWQGDTYNFDQIFGYNFTMTAHSQEQ
jgi:hypothetical protein